MADNVNVVYWMASTFCLFAAEPYRGCSLSFAKIRK